MSINNKTENKKIYFEENIFLLRMIMQICPARVFLEIAVTLISKVTEFALYVLLIRYLLNTLSGNPEFSTVAKTVCIVLLLRFLAYIIQDLYNKYYVPKSDIRIKAVIQEKIYKKSAEMDIRCYENPIFYDEYMKSIEKASQCVMDTLKIISQFFGLVAYILLTGGVIFIVSKAVFLILIFPICVGGLVSKKCNDLNKKIYDESMPSVRQRDYINRVYNLRGYAEDLRTTKIHRLIFFRMEEAVKEIIQIRKKYGKSLVAWQYGFYLANEVMADLFVFVYASYSALVTHSIMLGDFYMLIDSLGDVTWALRDAVDTLFKIQKNGLFIQSFKKFLEYKNTIEDGALKFSDEMDKVDVEFQNVCFRYNESGPDVLNDINFTVRSGEKILIVGENGSGKTTLVKLLLRLYDVDGGAIKVNGENIKDYSVDDYRSLFATMFQDYKLFALSIKDNILMMDQPSAENADVEKALEQVGIMDKISQCSGGIDSIISHEYTEDGVEFSVGEQQKLALARMLSKHGKIFVLDEPSSSLDPIAEHQIFELVCKECKDQTVIFISHRMSSALLADRIFYLEKGRIEETGTFEELMGLRGKFYKMFKCQSEKYNDDEEDI